MFRLPSMIACALLVGAEAFAQDKISDVDKIFSWVTPASPGCAVGVSQHGKVLLNKQYGLGDVPRGIPIGATSTFDIGSTQKQFAAAALLLLSEDKRLSLSDDVRKHIPELPDYGRKITIDHLLTHTSGIRDWIGLQGLSGGETDAWTLIMRQQGLNFNPGEEWSYSNSGFVLLKEIVARASGMSYADFTRKRLFEPLGMKSTSYVVDALAGQGNVALAYAKDGAGWKESMRLGNARGGGTLMSTTGDLLLWNDALTNARLGTFVTDKLHEPARLSNGRKLIYTRGLFVDKYKGLDRVWHSGGAAGYNAWLGRFPKQGLSVAMLCNLDEVSATATAHRVAELFLPATTASPVAAAPAIAVDSTRAGVFIDERTGNPLTLILNNGQLRVPGGRAPIVPAAADRFHIPGGDLLFRSQDEFELRFLSQDEFEIRSMEGETTRYRRARPYSPAAAELKEYAGRYDTSDLGGGYEIKSGPESITIHRVGSDGGGTEVKAIARDIFQRGAIVIRFRRDQAGKIVSFEMSNPILRNVTIKRVGV